MDLCSRNGSIIDKEDASLSVFSVEFSYGFGVYENVRVSKGEPLYLNEHIARLFKSAQEIELEHEFSDSDLQSWTNQLINQLDEDNYNLKILLIGAKDPKNAEVFILPLKPKYPDRKLYKKGVKLITADYERYIPNAKTLNMLPSYLLYRRAQSEGAYDCLLLNRNGEITEGTRTNFFGVKDKTLVTPPAYDVLVGVTRTHVMDCAIDAGFEVKEEAVSIDNIDEFNSAFITSTSSKIMPVNQIDEKDFVISDELKNLMKKFKEFTTSI
jgi:branched-chain amino acid aminotransferase